MQIVPLQVLDPVFDLVLLFLLLVVGLVVIVLLAKFLIFILPAGIIALVVWFLTGSVFWAGVAFLLVALISLIRRGG